MKLGKAAAARGEDAQGCYGVSMGIVDGSVRGEKGARLCKESARRCVGTWCTGGGAV